MSKRILFFGNERLATGIGTTAPVFRALIENGYDIAALVVAQKETGPSRKPRPLEIVEIAEAHNIPVLAPAKLSGATGELAACGAEAAVLIAYGKLVPQSVIDLFPAGIINLHPSLLPKHRGSTPIESVILNGETETGISLMQLAVEMDAGPLYAQSHYSVPAGISKAELAQDLLEVGAQAIISLLPGILDGSCLALPQDHNQATIDKQIQKEDGIIDWRKPAVQLEREIRAYAGWPRSRTTLGGVDVIITAAHTGEGSGTPGELYKNSQGLGVYTSKGLLFIDKLTPVGKKEMSAQAFQAGYRL
jgi:methionyl-tRNA formyltransferase